MCHLLAGLFSSGFTGCCGDKSYLMHFGRPLFIMVSLSRLLPIVVLPQVYHFMCEGRENFIWFPRGKVDWIKRDLIGYFLWVRSICGALPGAETACAFMSLHRYQDRRQNGRQKALG